ncbi:ArsR/SmtB family transcription factor [Nitrosopumilus adriaticus]|uniref:ArsR family transcriptional regulator n=1 Tax=Nitrosopumilus adriaticus TaxID=1580092 RepID=A0A0D5C3X0_9ARCH|nr:winged helix-turn-helix domain-containing protein [Nitrosopumilus adriaticus]AJW71391.1 ArsR family transcriptional regulator [Nitrosopumilus adriaticus]
MSSKIPDDDFTEKIKILATDDKKIKMFGELFTNDSSREILQLLFNEELTATQISQKTEISLQLVKYHLNKLQDLGVVKISKIEKNSKSQDMKIYTATKFSIVIVPPSFSEKTKESKLLVRSFRHIYKVAGLGIATGFSAIISLSQLEDKVPSSMISSRIASPELSAKTSESIGMDESAESIAASPMVAESESHIQLEKSVESQDYIQENLDVVETVIDSDVSNLGTELFIPFVILTAILGGITVYYLIKYLKNSN